MKKVMNREDKEKKMSMGQTFKQKVRGQNANRCRFVGVQSKKSKEEVTCKQVNGAKENKKEGTKKNRGSCSLILILFTA